jgi:hypothetical protein
MFETIIDVFKINSSQSLKDWQIPNRSRLSMAEPQRHAFNHT